MTSQTQTSSFIHLRGLSPPDADLEKAGKNRLERPLAYSGLLEKYPVCPTDGDRH